MSHLEITHQNNDPTLFNRDGTSYQTYGTSGHSLIFIHGVGMCADIWEPQVEYFAEKFQVLTYDLLGHGQTQLNNNLPQLNDYVEQLNNLVNSLNISKFFLVGHSMGAIISIAYSLKYPGKILSLIPLNIVFNRTKKARNDVLKRAESILNSKKYSILIKL